MSMTIVCSCGKKYALKEPPVAGKRLRCRECGEELEIPAISVQRTSKKSQEDGEFMSGLDAAVRSSQSMEGEDEAYDEPPRRPLSRERSNSSKRSRSSGRSSGNQFSEAWWNETTEMGWTIVSIGMALGAIPGILNAWRVSQAVAAMGAAAPPQLTGFAVGLWLAPLMTFALVMGMYLRSSIITWLHNFTMRCALALSPILVVLFVAGVLDPAQLGQNASKSIFALSFVLGIVYAYFALKMCQFEDLPTRQICAIGSGAMVANLIGAFLLAAGNTPPVIAQGAPGLPAPVQMPPGGSTAPQMGSTAPNVDSPVAPTMKFNLPPSVHDNPAARHAEEMMKLLPRRAGPNMAHGAPPMTSPFPPNFPPTVPGQAGVAMTPVPANPTADATGVPNEAMPADGGTMATPEADRAEKSRGGGRGKTPDVMLLDEYVAGEPKDLLPIIKKRPQRTKNGGVKPMAKSILMGFDWHGMVMVDQELPKAYQLDIEVRRIAGSETLAINLPFDHGMVGMELDSWNQTKSGIAFDHVETDGPLIGPKLRQLQIRVGLGELELKVDDEIIFQRNKIDLNWSKPGFRHKTEYPVLAFGTSDSRFEFTKFEFRELKAP